MPIRRAKTDALPVPREADLAAFPRDRQGLGVRPYLTTILLPDDVDVETALRMLRAEVPNHEIRVLSW